MARKTVTLTFDFDIEPVELIEVLHALANDIDRDPDLLDRDGFGLYNPVTGVYAGNCEVDYDGLY